MNPHGSRRRSRVGRRTFVWHASKCFHCTQLPLRQWKRRKPKGRRPVRCQSTICSFSFFSSFWTESQTTNSRARSSGGGRNLCWNQLRGLAHNWNIRGAAGTSTQSVRVCIAIKTRADVALLCGQATTPQNEKRGAPGERTANSLRAARKRR